MSIVLLFNMHRFFSYLSHLECRLLMLHELGFQPMLVHPRTHLKRINNRPISMVLIYAY